VEKSIYEKIIYFDENSATDYLVSAEQTENT